MDELRIKAEEKKTLDRSTLHVVSRVMAHLQTVNYPEARRVLNRCYRSPIEKLSDLADNCLREAARTYFRSSPYQAELGKVLDLRKEKKHKEAIAAATDLLSKDPFYTTLYVSRASLFLRTGSPELAMQDLEAARQQNPEDAVIEMIAAIAMVRLGNVEQGIAEAERFLAQIPDLPTQLRRDAIYNTACVYGRASEVAPNTELQSRHVDKAMKLLTECVERKEGFDDVEHLLDDPDLKMLHKHPDWQAIVEGVRKNEQNKPKA